MAATVAMTPKLAQLYAMRAQLDAWIRDEETALTAVIDPTACPQCGAPEDKIADASTMGNRRKHCTVCDGEWYIT